MAAVARPLARPGVERLQNIPVVIQLFFELGGVKVLGYNFRTITHICSLISHFRISFSRFTHYKLRAVYPGSVRQSADERGTYV